jgi:uncharacterized protein
VKRLLEPLAAVDRRAMVSVLGGLLLLSLYLYQGHHSFFARRFGHHLLGSPYAQWVAQGWQFGAAWVLLLLSPLLWIRLGLRQRVATHGLALGDWRVGLRLLLLGAVGLALPLYLNGGAADFQAEYPLVKIAASSATLFALWELTYLGYYIAWEFFFRGFWQLGLSGSLGAWGAMALQTAASTIMHIGKPEGETIAAIVAGVAFGLIALRTRSVLYVILLHWIIGMLTDLFCLLRAA